MAGLDSCTFPETSDLELRNNLVHNSQEELNTLQEDFIISEEALDNLWKYFDGAFKDAVFNSEQEINNMIIFMVGFALGDYGFNFSGIDTFEEIDTLFELNRLAPIFSSTIIVQNENGTYTLQGTISKLSCHALVSTHDFVPQEIYQFDKNVSVPMYGEILYSFENGGNKYGSFQYSTNNIFIMSGVISEKYFDNTDEVIQAHIDVILSNELGHLQFHDIIVPKYGFTRDIKFEFAGEEFSFQQMDELWSDYSSFTKAYNISEETGNWDIVSDEATRITWGSEGIEQYNLTRAVFRSVFEIGVGTDTFLQDLKDLVFQVLESAKI